MNDVANAITTEPLGWILVVTGGLAIGIGGLLSPSTGRSTPPPSSTASTTPAPPRADRTVRTAGYPGERG